jgi:hypothetical protein
MEWSFVKSVEGKLEAMSEISLQETGKAGIVLCLEIRSVCDSVACAVTGVCVCGALYIPYGRINGSNDT